MEWLSLAFMQRALLAALITGVTAPAIGTFLVQRRLSLLGDGLGHLAVAGVGLAFLTGTAPLPMAVVICVLGSIGIEMLRESGRASGDVGLAILFYGGLSGGLLLAGLAGQGAGTLSAYLFGSLLTVTTAGPVGDRRPRPRRARRHPRAVAAAVHRVRGRTLRPLDRPAGALPQHPRRHASPRSPSPSPCGRWGCCWSAR